jgi:hypothetical protein
VSICFCDALIKECQLKPKQLQNTRIAAPPRSGSTIVGAVENKDTIYDVWISSRDSLLDEDSASPGEELSTLSVLLPRTKKNGRLFQGRHSFHSFGRPTYDGVLTAPKPITRHLVVTAPLARPSAGKSDGTSSQPYNFVNQNPPRHAYPEEILTHRFVPFGSGTPLQEVNADVEMRVDDAPVEPVAKTVEKVKSKKRKDEEPNMRRAKKAKT